MNKILLLLSLMLLSCHTLAQQIYLFRHAEKQIDGSKNPPLTTLGQNRAYWLAGYLSDKNINVIYSSDYQRTMQTVAPLANQLKLKIRTYDPRQLQALKQQVQKTSGNIVIVGHSNTIAETVNILGGKGGADIPESEYDRLYLLSVKNAKVSTTLLRSEPQQSTKPSQ